MLDLNLLYKIEVRMIKIIQEMITSKKIKKYVPTSIFLSHK